MRGLAAGAAALLILLTGCFGPDPNLTETGKGRPVLSVEFPEEAAPGAVETATLTVENPGPGDIEILTVAFAGVGVPAASGPLPADLVPVTTTPDNPAVASVEPEPQKVSNDGVVYYFGRLGEGDTTEIAFDLVLPKTPGPVASSVSVYDAREIDRIRGVRLATAIRG